MKSGKLKILLLVAGIMIFNSCKQDKIFGDITPNTDRPIIEFSEPSGFTSIAVDYSTSFVDIDVTDIRFMIRTKVTQNATAKVIITPGIVYDYNDNNGTNYTVVPASLYGLLDNEVTLTAAERSKSIRIHLKPSDVASGQNAIGISIAEVSGGEVSRIAATLVIAISVKNKYDGVYELKGHHNRSPYNFPYDVTMNMITSDASSVAFYYPDRGDYGHPIGIGPDPVNDVNWYGSDIAPVLVFDPVTNLVTNIYNGAGPATPIVLYTGPGAPVSRYDPATKTIYAYFYYFTGPGQDFSNRGWSDTLTYTGPR